MKIADQKKLFKEVSTILKLELPYYEAEDKDDFFYLARPQHIHSATMRIIDHLKKTREVKELCNQV